MNMPVEFESNSMVMHTTFGEVQQIPSAEIDAYLKSAVESYLATSLPTASGEKLGGVKVGESLIIDEFGVLNVNVAHAMEEDNTLPITSAAVYGEVGNINALLASI